MLFSGTFERNLQSLMSRIGDEKVLALVGDSTNALVEVHHCFGTSFDHHRAHLGPRVMSVTVSTTS
jgi:hypothetical protein